MTITDELKELYSSSGADVIVHTLEFNHTSWPGPFYIVRGFEDFSANLEDSGPVVVFQKFAFNIQGPNKDVMGSQTLKINVDSVSTELVDLLELAIVDTNNVPIEVKFRIYLESDTTAPQNDPPLKLWMRKVTVDNFKVSGQAELVNLANRVFPNVKYGPHFKSLLNI